MAATKVVVDEVERADARSRQSGRGANESGDEALSNAEEAIDEADGSIEAI